MRNATRLRTRSSKPQENPRKTSAFKGSKSTNYHKIIPKEDPNPHQTHKWRPPLHIHVQYILWSWCAVSTEKKKCQKRRNEENPRSAKKCLAPKESYPQTKPKITAKANQNRNQTLKWPTEMRGPKTENPSLNPRNRRYERPRDLRNAKKTNANSALIWSFLLQFVCLGVIFLDSNSVLKRYIEDLSKREKSSIVQNREIENRRRPFPHPRTWTLLNLYVSLEHSSPRPRNDPFCWERRFAWMRRRRGWALAYSSSLVVLFYWPEWVSSKRSASCLAWPIGVRPLVSRGQEEASPLRGPYWCLVRYPLRLQLRWHPLSPFLILYIYLDKMNRASEYAHERLTHICDFRKYHPAANVFKLVVEYVSSVAHPFLGIEINHIEQVILYLELEFADLFTSICKLISRWHFSPLCLGFLLLNDYTNKVNQNAYRKYLLLNWVNSELRFLLSFMTDDTTQWGCVKCGDWNLFCFS